MKIGINTLFMIPGEVGGTETYLCETLVAMAERFPDVGLVLFVTKDNRELFQRMFSGADQVSMQDLGFHATNRHARILREQVQLPLKVKQVNVDILWSPGYTAPFLCSCPQVVTIHDMQYKTHPEDLTWSARVVTDILVRGSASRCHAVVADSAFSGEEIARFTSATPEKISVVPLGVSPDFEKPVQAGQSPRPFLLCVANTYPHKNVHTLVEAFRLIQDDIPHDLVLVGRPRRGEPDLIQAVTMLDDPSRVVRHTGLDRTELIRLYQQADLFAFPSLYEGFGLPVLEAMRCGVPVVTTRGGSLPETGGDHVVYCDGTSAEDLGTHMLEILRWDAETRSQRIEAAIEHACGFNWEHTSEALVKLFQRVLNG